jgi:hypothetical protein
MSDDDLRNCFAMMITVGMAIDNGNIDPRAIWNMADAIVEARRIEEDDGIVSIKKRTRKPK